MTIFRLGAAAGASGSPPAGLWTPVATRCLWPNNRAGDGTINAESTRLHHRSYLPASALRVLYVNVSRGFSDDWFGEFTTAGSPGNTLDELTVGTGLELPALTTHPVTYGGAMKGSLDVSQILLSDWTGLPVGLNADLYSRNYVKVKGTTSGQEWPIGQSVQGEGVTEGTNRAVNAADLTRGATIPATGSVAVFGPLAILGHVTGQTVSTIGIGDSIMAGTGEASGDQGVEGWALRALAKITAVGSQTLGWPTTHAAGAVPFLNAAMGDEKAKNAAKVINFRARTVLAQHFTHALLGLGTNDVIAGDSAANIITYLGTVATNLKANLLGDAKVIGVTLLPLPDVSGSTAKLTTINAWIRGGGGGLYDGIVELSDALSTARDSNVWKPSHSGDNIHPSPTGHAAGAAVVDLGLFA